MECTIRYQSLEEYLPDLGVEGIQGGLSSIFEDSKEGRDAKGVLGSDRKLN